LRKFHIDEGKDAAGDNLDGIVQKVVWKGERVCVDVLLEE